MKKLMPFIVAGALLMGASCSTYTSTTDPADEASGWGFPNDKDAAESTSSPAVAETSKIATPAQSGAQADTAAAPVADTAASAEAH